MHVDAIQHLICPAAHDPAALVASAWEQHDHRIVQGALGCPRCGAEYPIREGVADFRQPNAAERAPSAEVSEPPNEAAVVRLAAQLDLSEPGRLVLLLGAYAALAPALSVMFDAQCLVAGAEGGLERHVAALASVMRVGASLPLAQASLHGVAMDDPHVALMGLTQACAILRPRGRLVAPAGAPAGTGMTELARDEREWVATRTLDGGPVVTLKRAAR